MLDLFALEQSVVQRLLPALTPLGFRVEQFPGDMGEFSKPVGKGRVFVGFRLQKLNPPSSMVPRTQIIQVQTFNFQVIYQNLDLRSHQTVLNALPLVQERLTGFRPFADEPHGFYLLEAGLIEVIQGSWMYSQMFAIEIPYLQRVNP